MNDETILTEIKKILKNKNITPKNNLRDLGIDSLDLLDLILEVEEKYGIKVEDEQLLELNTIQDFIDVIKSKM